MESVLGNILHFPLSIFHFPLLMSPESMGLLIGGIVPALLISVSNVLIKDSTQQGISMAMYVIVVGFAVSLTGVALFFVSPDKSVSLRSGTPAFFAGACWAMGVAAVTIGMNKYGAPLGKLVPLFNMNTLFSVLIALWIFAEWKQVHVPKLLIGTLLIVVGGTLVSRA